MIVNRPKLVTYEFYRESGELIDSYTQVAHKGYKYWMCIYIPSQDRFSNSMFTTRKMLQFAMKQHKIGEVCCYGTCEPAF